MAEQVAAVTVQVDSSQAIQSMSELRGQIQSANDRLLQMINQFGEGSAEAAQAATEVQRLRGQIEAANRLTQAMDPAAPFNAVMGVLGGIAGGIAAVQGAMALFGSESKEVEQVLLKVNAAMALASGINAVTQSIESFSTLAATLQRIPIINTIITATQRMWNQAVAANPIMTMVAAITLAVAAIGALAYWFIKSASDAKKQQEQIKKNKEELDRFKQAMKDQDIVFERAQKHQLEMAKASGANTEAIRKLERKLIDEKIAYAEAAAAAALNTVEINKNRLANLKAADAGKDEIKAQQEVVDASRELLKQKNEDVKKAGNERLDLINRQAVEVKQEQVNAEKEDRERRKEAAKKASEDAAKEAEDRKKRREEERKQIQEETKASAERTKALNNEIELQKIQDETARALRKLEIEKKAAEDSLKLSKATEEQKAKELKAINDKYLLDKAAIEEKARKDKEAKDNEARQKELQNEQATFDLAFQARMLRETNEFTKRQEQEAVRNQQEVDKLYALLNNKEIKQEVFNRRRESLQQINEFNVQKIAEDSAKAQKEIDEKAFQAKMDAYGKIGAMLGSFSELVGKETAAGKALAVAQASIDTYTAAWSAFKNAQKNPISIIGPAYPYIQAGLAVAGGIANIKKILAVPVPGKGGGGGTAPSGGVNASVNAPIPVQASTTMLDQNQVNQMASATARAFVVESDVSGNQERIRRLNRAARIN
jgi:hypothetical protein